MISINSYASALRLQNASRKAADDMASASQSLSTGKRINSGADDAAGLAISISMTSQIGGMNQAVRNANDGISLLQTADGALDEVTNMVQRIRELAVQSLSGTNSADDRAKMQIEVSNLTSQVASTLANTGFNGTPIFSTATTPALDTTIYRRLSNGTDAVITLAQAGFSTPGTALTIQTGANGGETTQIGIDNLATSFAYDTPHGKLGSPAANDDAGTMHLITFDDFAAGAKIAGLPVKQADIGTSAIQRKGDQWFTPDSGTKNQFSTTFSLDDEFDISNTYRANHALTQIDAYLKTISTARAGIGASESRLKSAVNVLTSTATNLTDARSHITDADFSAESIALAKAQILGQASTAMLAQANQSQQNVLKLLQQ